MKKVVKIRSKIFFTLLVSLIFIPLFAHAQTPLPCNQTVSDSISVVGETDEYTFDAAAGERVRIAISYKTQGSRKK